MTTRKEQLENELFGLSTDERADLARRLIESLEDLDAGDVDTLWIEEAERRYAAYRAGLSTARPGEEVFRRARAKLA